MALPSIFQTGRSGMVAAKAGISTSGHNVANANTEGFSRQRVDLATSSTLGHVGSKAAIGSGVSIERVARTNDEYIEKQVRTKDRDFSHFEEKDVLLRQVEDIFNEMGGDGLNRLMSRFFNEFRKLGNDPDSEAVRESVREASQAVINDFHRMMASTKDIQRLVDSRVEGYVREINSLADLVRDLNLRVHSMQKNGLEPNDLLDQRDLALKRLGNYLELSVHKDNFGLVNADIRGVGPLVTGPGIQKLSTERGVTTKEGMPENGVHVITEANSPGIITHLIKGGKLGALLDVRDRVLGEVQRKLDELAFSMATAVNQVHSQGVTRNGSTGISFFKPLAKKESAAQMLELSDKVKENVNFIGTALIANAPGDNRLAVAIANLQNMKLMNEGKTSFDDHYSAIVGEVGIMSGRNRENLSQTKDIKDSLNKMREQISGVSIDEETTKILQFQHAFDAAARVIRVADECLDTVLKLGT